MAFMFGGNSLADVWFDGVQGQPALGSYRLLCKVHFQFMPRKSGPHPTVIQSLQGDLYAVQASGEQRYIGVARQWAQQSAFILDLEGHRREFLLAIDLSTEQIVAIEELRLGGKVKFVLAVSAVVSVQGAAENPTEFVTHEVPQGVWVEVLGAMNFQDVALIEIPRGEWRKDPKLASALRYFENLRGHVQRGDWRSAVSSMRDVMESIDRVLGEEDPDGKHHTATPSLRDKGLPERLKHLRSALRLLAAPAKHADEPSEMVVWTRRDAILALHVSAAVLAHCSES